MEIQGGLFKRAGKFMLAQSVLIVAFFYFGVLVSYANEGVSFNEIAWMGNLNSPNDEWVELYNKSGEDIYLNGWRIEAADGSPIIVLEGLIGSGAYYLLERTDDNSAIEVEADKIYTGALGNGGEELNLYDDQNNIIDSLYFSEEWPAGKNEEKFTMAKSSSGEWFNSLEVGGTPGKNNQIVIEEAEEKKLQEEIIEDSVIENDIPTEVSNMGKEKENKTGEVLINEIVMDPVDDEGEWLELFNTSGDIKDVTSWYIEEGSGVKTKLEGEIGIGEDRFMLVISPKGNLNNSGDIIELRDDDGKLIDRVIYGDWNDTFIVDKAPNAPDPYSLIRQWDGCNTYNNSEDFKLTLLKTPGESNILENNTNKLTKNKYDYSDDIIITEIFPNPEGSDNNGEFIEIYNNGNRDIGLNGWSIKDNSQRKYYFNEDEILRSKRYLSIYRDESKIALNNEGDELNLFQPEEDTPSFSIKYISAIEKYSYAYDFEEEEYVWSEIVTPGKKNEILRINNLPEPSFFIPNEEVTGKMILFDSSDTIDKDDDILSYLWSFGDGVSNNLPNPEHTYFEGGEFVVKLMVYDGKDEVTIEKIIVIKEDKIDENTLSEYKNDLINLEISEIMPDPYGSDTNFEFIEIYNWGDESINLKEWVVDDREGGSAQYEFNNNEWLDEGSYLVLKRSKSKIALNNNSDEVRLMKNNKLVDSVSYDKSYEGYSYSKEADLWYWTDIESPGEKNVINFELELKLENESREKSISTSSICKIKEYELGETVLVEGTVTITPGVFGQQYFYIQKDCGVQIYNYNKRFPDIKIGDVVWVTGDLSSSYGELRIKTKEVEDIKIQSSNNDLIPKILKCSNLSEWHVGCLVSFDGEVVESKSSYLYIDDGSGEVRVNFKKGANIEKNIEEGEKVKVSGILDFSSGAYIIYPRSKEDISEDVATNDQAVLGEYVKSSSWSIGARDRRMEFFRYLLVIIFAVVIVIMILIIKALHTKN